MNNTLETTLQQDLIAAMKAKEDFKVSSIRAVKTAIQTEKTNGTYHELSDDDILKIIRKQVSERRESATIYMQASRADLAAKEAAEANFLEIAYLPKMLTSEEITNAVNIIIGEVGKNMGAIMKALKEKYPNQVDGKVASGIIKQLL